MAQKNDYLSRIKNNKLQHQNYETEASEINKEGYSVQKPRE